MEKNSNSQHRERDAIILNRNRPRDESHQTSEEMIADHIALSPPLLNELRLSELKAELADDGDFRLACHLIEFAAEAAPEDREVHAARAAIYRARRAAESSLMSKGIFAAAERESKAIAEPGDG